MSTVKKQHYVPQFYLKRFTFDGEHLFVYDKFNREIRQSPTRDVAEENYFYDLPDNGKLVNPNGEEVNRQVVEQTFQKIEGEYSQTLDQIIAAANKRAQQGPFRQFANRLLLADRFITNRQQKTLAPYIALQYLRTRELRQTLVEGVEEGRKAIFDLIAQFDLGGVVSAPDPVQVDKEAAAALHADFMFDDAFLNGLSKGLVESHYWFLGMNRTGNSLYTSDHPVALRGHVRHPFLGSRGLLSPGVEITFPLTPEYILVLAERRFHHNYRWCHRRYVTLCKENVRYYNSLQVAYSFRQVYCSDKVFADAEEFCKKNPQACQRDKPRIKVG